MVGVALSPDAAVQLATDLRRIGGGGRSERLEKIQLYLRDDPDERILGGLPRGTPPDVVRLARLSRVNMLKYVVNSRVQNLYVDGYRTPTKGENLRPWRDGWQANRFDARQIGVNRATLSFGKAYGVALVRGGRLWMRGASPREMIVGLPRDEPDADWPAAVLWDRGPGRWWLIDETSVYRMYEHDGAMVQAGDAEPHRMRSGGEPVCPVVRFRETEDLDDPERGIVEPLIPLQDQINITTFGLQVAQHFGAFRQLVILGWLAENEEQLLKRGASRVITFEDGPGEISVDALPQTDTRGYVESREANIRHLATVSQTPVNEMLGELVNLSAEALETLRASFWAAVDENQTTLGESYEQYLGLAGEALGEQPEPDATAVWRDTRIRSLLDAVNAFGAMVDKLGVPPRELWHRVPGFAQHEIERWRRSGAGGESVEDLMRMMGGSGGEGGSRTRSGLILPSGAGG